MDQEITLKPISFSNRGQWRSWLTKNHAKNKGVWVRFYKKFVQRGLKYTDAVEEALCFGWIDGQLRRIDDRRHMIRFSPRQPNSVWARSNIARVKKLIKVKRMTPAGLKLFKSAKLEQQTAPDASMPKSLMIPPDLKQALLKRPISWKHFQGYPPSNRRLAIWWVRTAKKPETRMRRIRNIVANAAKFARPQY